MGKNTILFVDDEVNILNSLRRGLIDEEYECIFASSGKEALELFNNNTISVIVTDMRMPGMDGLTLLKEVKEKFPQTVRIVLSGYTQLQQILVTINQADIFKFITKPWKLEEEFKTVINQALDYYNLQISNLELQKALENKNQAYQNILKNVDEVIANAKKESQYYKDLNNYVYKFLGENLKFQNPEQSSDGFIFCSKLCRRYFRVSTEEKEIDITNLLQEIKAIMENFKGVSKVEWSYDKDFSFKGKICTNVVEFIVSTLLEALISVDGKHHIKVLDDVKEIAKYGYTKDSVSFEISALFSALTEDRTAILKEKSEEKINFRVEFLRGFINELLKPFQGSFAITKMDISTGIKLQLRLEK